MATVGTFRGIVAAQIGSTIATRTHSFDDDLRILGMPGDNQAANLRRFAVSESYKDEIFVAECGAHAAPLHSKELSPPKSPGDEVSAQRKYHGQALASENPSDFASLGAPEDVVNLLDSFHELVSVLWAYFYLAGRAEFCDFPKDSVKLWVLL